ncbi:four-carbon acid sugar kinase family protein [Streptomyces lincolnensis]|uniref:four-carbon acid sugar kinase family protein n=1 Tax=Streptomyces lincolnensis TaxID=1915 RepID=UPI001E61BECC|nr:four-carbon acid sugar kinase family protein [Streptomyces lincolnensis]
MSLVPDRRVLALADDLTGAAETAVALRPPAGILLGPVPDPVPDPVPVPDQGRALVVDLDSRQLPGAEAARAVRAVTGSAPAGTVLFKKVDSLLRGNLAPEATAYADGCRGVVIATALPAAQRTVRDGVVRLRGVPLHATRAWQAESRPAPRSVRDALGDLPTAPLPLAVVRGARHALRDAMAAHFAQGRHPVCDAETDADLDAIAATALELGPGVRLLGTGGLAGALGRVLGTLGGTAAPRHADPATLAGTLGPPRGPTARGRSLLVVVGTAEPSAAEQVSRLVAEGAHQVPFTAHALLRTRQRVEVRPGEVTVVRVAGRPVLAQARRLAAALADTVAEAAHDGDLVLIGGETARRVLDALSITHLRPVGQIHHGAVLSHTPDGRRVVTRPGSYGEADSLLRITRALRPGGAPLVPTDPTGVTP